MAERNEHLVVIMLDGTPKGQEFEIWDRHITIVPWFPCDDAERLNKVLNGVAGRHESFKIKAGLVEEWGKKQKYLVQKLDDSDDLQQLHLDVFNSLETNNFPVHQKDFLGEKYVPHIALRNRLQKGNELGTGEEILIDKFTLVKQIRLKKSGRIIKTLVRDYELG